MGFFDAIVAVLCFKTFRASRSQFTEKAMFGRIREHGGGWRLLGPNCMASPAARSKAGRQSPTMVSASSRDQSSPAIPQPLMSSRNSDAGSTALTRDDRARACRRRRAGGARCRRPPAGRRRRRRLDALLQRNDLVVAGHHGDGAELQALGQVHGADRHAAVVSTCSSRTRTDRPAAFDRRVARGRAALTSARTRRSRAAAHRPPPARAIQCADGFDLLALGREACGSSGGGPLNTETVSPPVLAVAVHVGHLRAEQAVGLLADLVRRAVVDAQGARAAADVHAERLPRERLLEDALAEVAGEEQRVGPSAAERGEEAQLRDAEVLRLVHDREVEGRRLAASPCASARACEHARLGDQPARLQSARAPARRSTTAPRAAPPAAASCGRGGDVAIRLPGVQLPGIDDLLPFGRQEVQAELVPADGRRCLAQQRVDVLRDASRHRPELRLVEPDAEALERVNVDPLRRGAARCRPAA